MDVIWNLTRICPWNCAICCMSALHACEKTKDSLKKSQKKNGKELSLRGKMEILQDLCNEGFCIDFSGGDPLYYEEDFQIVEQATSWLPSSKITVSMTGIELTNRKIDLLKKVEDVEFTVDSLPELSNFARPQGFHHNSITAIKKCVDAGINTRAVTVLHPLTMRESNLRGIYEMFCKIGVSEWVLLRFYPVGRAKRFFSLMPSKQEYLKTMSLIRTFSGSTKILFQHSLRILEGKITCPAVRESVGILPDGSVSACAWAINGRAEPINDYFRLGKMPEQKISDIVKSAQEKLEYSNDVHESRIITWLEENN